MVAKSRGFFSSSNTLPLIFDPGILLWANPDPAAPRRQSIVSINAKYRLFISIFLKIRHKKPPKNPFNDSCYKTGNLIAVIGLNVFDDKTAGK
ncbi:MAG: hypothetical protein B7Y19_03780 [Sphingobacteriales bacterium 24-40-4]|nr:MAG: hypothetical protein B7Y19_03780 [Sphingobacteriales bacterium 24-40-4]